MMLNLLLKKEIRPNHLRTRGKNRDNFTNMEDLSPREDIDKLGEYIKTIPYNNRIEW